MLDSKSRGCCVVSLSNVFYSLISTSSTQKDLSRHDWKSVDLDVKNQNKHKKCIITENLKHTMVK